MSKKDDMSLQIYDREYSADSACSTFYNAGFNYKDIKVKDYSTVKVKVVDPERVKEQGGFWSIHGGGEKQHTNNFQVGDKGYIAVADEQIPEIVSWGLSILGVKNKYDEMSIEYLSDEQYNKLEERKKNLERAITSHTIWGMVDPPLKSPEEIKKLKESWKIEIKSIDKIFKDNKSRILSWSLYQESIKNSEE